MISTSLDSLPVGSAVGSDDSAVAVTLSWPLNAGDAPADASTRALHVVELIGDVDVTLAARVSGLLAALAAESADLAVDVSGVRYIDGGGLDLLRTLYGQVTARGGQLSLLGVGRLMERALESVELEHLLSSAS